MKIKETKNENIQITMTKKEAKEVFEFLSDKPILGAELDLWDLFFTNEHLL